MKLRIAAATALLTLATAAQACINSVGTDAAGRKFHPNWPVGEDVVRQLKGGVPPLFWVRSTIQEALTDPSFEHLNDLGVLLIRQGQFAAAVRHFVQVEKLYPGHYETAANLGTALELTGHDATALRWIRIGIRRNPEEHERSEWLHLRILEAKLALAKDPNHLQGRSVAGVAFAPTLLPPLPAQLPAGNDGRPVSPWLLNGSLSYQLHERLQFVRPPDPVVANLLRDWATLNLAGGPIETADAVYELAVRYGAERDALMTQRQRHIRAVLARSKDHEAEYDNCAICAPPPSPAPANDR